MKKYKACYRRKGGVNPFVPNYRALAGSICHITADVPSDMPLEQVKEMAKEATPNGFEFVEVKLVEKGGRT